MSLHNYMLDKPGAFFDKFEHPKAAEIKDFYWACWITLRKGNDLAVLSISIDTSKEKTAEND